MLAIVVAYHKNDNEEYLMKFMEMLESVQFNGFEENIFITLDGAEPSYIQSVIEKYKILPQNIIFSIENVGNYCLKFRLLEIIKNKYKFVKFCDFDDKSCSYKKLLRIIKLYEQYDLIVCRSSKWSVFVNYWEKIFSVKLLRSIPKFKCFTGGDVIICWMSFYECFKNNWQFVFCGEQIYYKNKIASRTCRESTPDKYLKLETESNEIKNILFYANTIESKHIYEKSSNILDIDFNALIKTINLNDFITRLMLHYKF